MEKEVTIILSQTAEGLRNALSNYDVTATVEAEYGDEVVEGTVETFAHHGPRYKNLCPCLEEVRNLPNLEAIGISHLDLDTLGGICSLLNLKPGPVVFWETAADIDLHGRHAAAKASVGTMIKLNAYYAMVDKYKYDRNVPVQDVTEMVYRQIDDLYRICAYDSDLIREGVAYEARQEMFEKETFSAGLTSVCVRETKVGFVNNLYYHEGKKYSAVVGFNKTYGSITLSFCSPEDANGFDATLIMREHFGDKAGGRELIAGSPRGERYTMEEAMSLASNVDDLLA